MVPFCSLCAGKDKNDFYEQVPIMLRELLYRLNDENETVLVASNAALSSLSKHVSAEELVNHIEFIRNLIASMVSESRRRKGGVGDGEFLLPGFNMPKGEPKDNVFVIIFTYQEMRTTHTHIYSDSIRNDHGGID